VVIDENGENLGEIERLAAINIAKERELDLVLVSPNAEVPVGRIVDWAKFKYEKSKKLRKNKAKVIETKEWWFKPGIEDRDIEMKLEKVKKFLNTKAGSAKLTVKYNRKIPYEMMVSTYDRIAARFEDFAKPVGERSKDGRNISIIIKAK
jgi:translation initiation factor IF-3